MNCRRRRRGNDEMVECEQIVNGDQEAKTASDIQSPLNVTGLCPLHEPIVLILPLLGVDEWENVGNWITKACVLKTDIENAPRTINTVYAPGDWALNEIYQLFLSFPAQLLLDTLQY